MTGGVTAGAAATPGGPVSAGDWTGLDWTTFVLAGQVGRARTVPCRSVRPSV